MSYRFSQSENHRFNEKEDFGSSFKMNGFRDVPIKLREKFEKMVKETFSPEDTPISYEYSSGTFSFEGKIYLHKLEVAFMYWDGYHLHVDYINFLS